MRRRVTTRAFLAGLALLAALACSSGPADPPPATDAPDVVAGQVLVRLVAGVPIDRVNARYGTRTLAALDDGRTFVLGVPAGETAAETVARMAGDPDLVAASPNPIAEAPEAEARSTMAFADPALVESDYTDQAALERIRAPEAWATTRGAGVIVAVLDTGIEASHPILAGRILPGVDLVDGDFDPADRPDGIDSDGDGRVDEAVGHGTFVAGLILSVAPEVRILPIRVLDSDGVGTAAAVARGLEIARERGAQVVNLSLGMAIESDVIEDLLKEHADEGLVAVASAGNLASGERRYPAGSAEAVGVAAVGADDRRAEFSNFGSWVRIAAPGVGLVAPWWEGGLAVWSGTSFAAALVSGAAALLFAAEPRADADDVADALERSAAELPDGGLGEGRLDIEAALEDLKDRL